MDKEKGGYSTISSELKSVLEHKKRNELKVKRTNEGKTSFTFRGEKIIKIRKGLSYFFDDLVVNSDGDMIVPKSGNSMNDYGYTFINNNNNKNNNNYHHHNK